MCSDTAQPEAQLFYEWCDAMIPMKLCIKAQSVEVNGVDMLCNVRRIILQPVSH